LGFTEVFTHGLFHQSNSRFLSGPLAALKLSGRYLRSAQSAQLF
jgi:hypothetical protein